MDRAQITAAAAADDAILVSVPRAAELVGVSPATMWRVIQDGVVPTVRLRGCTRIRTADLHALPLNR